MQSKSFLFSLKKKESEITTHKKKRENSLEPALEKNEETRSSTECFPKLCARADRELREGGRRRVATTGSNGRRPLQYAQGSGTSTGLSAGLFLIFSVGRKNKRLRNETAWWVA